MASQLVVHELFSLLSKQIRWMQLSSLTPRNRNHGVFECFNTYLNAKFFRGNKAYLHFISFLHIHMTQVV